MQGVVEIPEDQYIRFNVFHNINRKYNIIDVAVIQVSKISCPEEYPACKAGLTTMGNVMAKEFAPYDITVNTLAISAIETDMLSQLPRDKIQQVIAGLPIPRFANAEDIVNVLDFFASDRSSYLTAQTLYLGGLH